MSLFGSKEKKLVIHSLIDSKCKFVGNISFEGGMQVNGTLNGNVIGEGADAVLIIEDGASITGRVEAENLIIDGIVNGPVVGKGSVVIRKNGKVKGNVAYGRIQMEDGACVEGQLLPASAVESSESFSKPAAA